jgi:hypothetical protein
MSLLHAALHRESTGRAEARARAIEATIWEPKRPYPVGTRQARRHLARASVTRPIEASPSRSRSVPSEVLALCVARCHKPREKAPARPMTRARLNRAARRASR